MGFIGKSPGNSPSLHPRHLCLQRGGRIQELCGATAVVFPGPRRCLRMHQMGDSHGEMIRCHTGGWRFPRIYIYIYVFLYIYMYFYIYIYIYIYFFIYIYMYLYIYIGTPNIPKPLLFPIDEPFQMILQVPSS